MRRRTIRIIFVTLLSFAAFAPAAPAATPAAIHRDAADGSIDGSYTLADLRQADRHVSAEQREYFGWDDLYREHVRSLAAPREGDAPKLDPESVPARDVRTRAARPEPGAQPEADPVDRSERPASRTGRTPKRVVNITAAAPSQPAIKPARRASSNSLSLFWALAIVPILIVATGVWQICRLRRRSRYRSES